MFHAFDNPTSQEPMPRAEWMALLARAPHQLMLHALADHATAQPHWLRRPETGLMMVQGRAGGTGERFNLGELTVTRCALRLPGAGSQSPVGVSYVMGRSHRQAQLAAVADALLQNPSHYPELELRLLAPVREHLQALQTQRQQRAQSTKVDFLTVARVAGGSDEEDEA